MLFRRKNANRNDLDPEHLPLMVCLFININTFIRSIYATSLLFPRSRARVSNNSYREEWGVLKRREDDGGRRMERLRIAVSSMMYYTYKDTRDRLL